MPDTDPLELVQEQATWRTGTLPGYRYSSAGEVIRWNVTLSPRASGDWHLVLRWYGYWDDRLLGQRSYTVDDYATAVQTIESVWEEQDQDGHQSDPEAGNPST